MRSTRPSSSHDHGAPASSSRLCSEQTWAVKAGRPSWVSRWLPALGRWHRSTWHMRQSMAVQSSSRHADSSVRPPGDHSRRTLLARQRCSARRDGHGRAPAAARTSATGAPGSSPQDLPARQAPPGKGTQTCQPGRALPLARGPLLRRLTAPRSLGSVRRSSRGSRTTRKACEAGRDLVPRADLRLDARTEIRASDQHIRFGLLRSGRLRPWGRYVLDPHPGLVAAVLTDAHRAGHQTVPTAVWTANAPPWATATSARR